MIIKAGQYYKKKENGNFYNVLCLATDVTYNQEREVVVYSQLRNKEPFYTCSTSEFFDKFEETK